MVIGGLIAVLTLLLLSPGLLVLDISQDLISQISSAVCVASACPIRAVLLTWIL
jgi:hypothetical protein